LEFRFNELVTHEDEGDLGSNKQTNQNEANKHDDICDQFKCVIDKLEGQVLQMDNKISNIGELLSPLNYYFYFSYLSSEEETSPRRKFAKV